MSDYGIDEIPEGGNQGDRLQRDLTVPAGVSWIAPGLPGATIAAHQGVVAAPAAVTSAAPAALTSSQNATANAAAQTGAYVQADVQSIATLANALKVSYNALQVDVVTDRAERTAVQADVVALRAEVAALTTAVNALNAALQTAHLES